MIKIAESYVPKEFHDEDPKRLKMKQDNATEWNLNGTKVPIVDSITMSGKIGGISELLKRLVDFSCEVDLTLRIVNGQSFLTGSITVYRKNILDIIEHLLREVDLLAYAIAHGFQHEFEINFTCKQTIKFSLTA